MTTAWTGASHSGQAPAKCSISSAMNRSKLPKMAVDDDRPVLRVIGADVLQVEPLGYLVIELNRRALPLPPMASVTSKSIFGP